MIKSSNSVKNKLKKIKNLFIYNGMMLKEKNKLFSLENNNLPLQNKIFLKKYHKLESRKANYKTGPMIFTNDKSDQILEINKLKKRFKKFFKGKIN